MKDILTTLFDHDFIKEFVNDFNLPYGRFGATNIIENETNFQLEVSLAGVKKENINIKIDNNELIISAITGEKEDSKTYHRREFFKQESEFKRKFKLLDNINQSEIKAKFDLGILTIILNKKLVSDKKDEKIITIE